MIHRQLVLTQVGVFELYCPRARACVCSEMSFDQSRVCVFSVFNSNATGASGSLSLWCHSSLPSNHEVMLTCI